MKMRDLIDPWIAGEIAPAAIEAVVGFRLTGYEEGQARVEMDTTRRHYNPMGTVHGGVLCDIADAAMGVAFAGGLAEGESFTTVDLNIRFFRPVGETHLVAIARVVHRGKTVGSVECEVTDAEGRPVARASSTCIVLRASKA